MTPSAIPFSSADRVLIIAPHPDDETLGAAGAIQSALEAGARVKVLYLTDGEGNALAFLFHRRRIPLRAADFAEIGRLRRAEAASAMGVLGVGEENLIFMGYPDRGILAAWRQGAANIVRDFEEILSSFRPTRIFVTSPWDSNADHRAAYLCLSAALSRSNGGGIAPAVYLYPVHGHRPKRHPAAERRDFRWVRLPMSPEQVSKKERAVGKYESQLSYKRGFLLSFVKADELFAVSADKL